MTDTNRAGKPGKFSGLLIASDFDLTFFDKGFIPERNIEATRYFMENGGLFTISTARPVDSLERFLPMFSINAPAILSNGGVIYDYQNRRLLHACYLPPRALAAAREVYERFPGARIELFTATGVGIARELPILSEKEQSTRPQGNLIDIYSFDEPVTRIVYLAEKELTAEIADYVMSRSDGEYGEIRSMNNFYNVMPNGVSKGAGLIRLAEILGIPIENTYCIGDDYNDVEMLKTAGVGACPENAVQAVKEICDIVVCAMNDGAVAGLIDYIDTIDAIDTKIKK